jgi:hypothetical protein
MGGQEVSGLLVYVVVCAAPPAARVGEFLALADRRGWEVAVVASPDAVPFLDPAGLEHATGHPVRSAWRRSDEPTSVPDSTATPHPASTWRVFPVGNGPVSIQAVGDFKTGRELTVFCRLRWAMHALHFARRTHHGIALGGDRRRRTRKWYDGYNEYGLRVARQTLEAWT